MEYKAIETSIKTIADRQVTGIAAVTGNIDSGSDRIMAGAFRKTLKENGGRIRLLWMHDPLLPPPAVVKALREVPADELPDELRSRAPEATGGLEVVREYLRTPRGDEILEGIKAGAINEMSIGFSPIKFDFEERKDDTGVALVRNLREVRLWDVSDVTWGMNERTVASKALALAPWLDAYQEHLPAEQYTMLTNLVQTVERATRPEQLKAGRVLSARNLGRLKDALDVLTEILLAAEPPSADEDAKALTDRIMVALKIHQAETYLLGA